MSSLLPCPILRWGTEQAVQAAGHGQTVGQLLLNALLDLGRNGTGEERLAASLALENLAAGSPAASKALLSAGAHVMVSPIFSLKLSGCHSPPACMPYAMWPA